MNSAEIETLFAEYESASNVESYEAAINYFMSSTIPFRLSAENTSQLKLLLPKIVHVEAFLAYLLTEYIWQFDQTNPMEFLNLWECARYSGNDARFTRLSTTEHLTIAQRLREKIQRPATFILLGNVLRKLHRYSSAEDVYLEGIHHFPADSILKFRLADLYLATYRLSQAQQILNHLKPCYPFAREVMFVGPTNELQVPGEIFQELPSGNAEIVWFVAADTTYTEKYALNLARSVHAVVDPVVHLHIHTLRDLDQPLSSEVTSQLTRLFPQITLTERQLDLKDANPNWSKALFSSERFLFLAEIITKYRKPILVTDIDVECIKSPQGLFAELAGFDFGYTKFRNTIEAWERYAATALLIQPTDNAISFFQRMGAMVLSILNTFPMPWFVDQIALFRLIEEFPLNTKVKFLPGILTDTDPPSPNGVFKILHGSWHTG